MWMEALRSITSISASSPMSEDNVKENGLIRPSLCELETNKEWTGRSPNNNKVPLEAGVRLFPDIFYLVLRTNIMKAVLDESIY